MAAISTTLSPLSSRSVSFPLLSAIPGSLSLQTPLIIPRILSPHGEIRARARARERVEIMFSTRRSFFIGGFLAKLKPLSPFPFLLVFAVSLLRLFKLPPCREIDSDRDVAGMLPLVISRHVARNVT